MAFNTRRSHFTSHIVQLTPLSCVSPPHYLLTHSTVLAPSSQPLFHLLPLLPFSLFPVPFSINPSQTAKHATETDCGNTESIARVARRAMREPMVPFNLWLRSVDLDDSDSPGYAELGPQ